MMESDLKFLVVDDVSSMRTLIKSLLRGFGFANVTSAKSGEEAQKMLDEGDFEFILADWHMSPGNGLELLNYVRETPRLQKIPFIMVTAENTKDKILEAIHFGVDDYIVKPFTTAQLEEKVLQVLVRKDSKS